MVCPRWAAEPLSGAGAARYGGRFNAKGTAILDASLSPLTAVKEAQAVGTFQPITLVAYRADIGRLLDTRDADALASFGITPAILADAAWREALAIGQRAPTQDSGAAAKRARYQALLVPSFGRGTGAKDLNVVLLNWNARSGAKLEVIDDEGRLRVL